MPGEMIENRRHFLDASSAVEPQTSKTSSAEPPTFGRTAAPFGNPDYVAIVIHNHRSRLALAGGEPKSDVLRKRLAESPVITAPSITREGDTNGAPQGGPGANAEEFSGNYAHRTITGVVEHNLRRIAPRGFVKAIVDVGGD
jgi:hypothetical protein